jgi:hypothetical protein
MAYKNWATGVWAEGVWAEGVWSTDSGASIPEGYGVVGLALGAEGVGAAVHSGSGEVGWALNAYGRGYGDEPENPGGNKLMMLGIG